MKSCILYVDDEVANLDSFQLVFLGIYKIFVADNAQQGLEIIRTQAAQNQPIRLVISDQKMPNMTGIEFLGKVNEEFPDIVKILLTAYGDIELVTEAINRVGIYKFVTKPWDEPMLRQIIDRGLEHYQLQEENKVLLSNLQETNVHLKDALSEVEELKNRLQAENQYLRGEIEWKHNFKEIITQSKLFRKTLISIEQVAKTDTTVLIMGETGTGKELIARALHNLSMRQNKPLVKLNCAALPANLIESELFGHEKGAFTGALNQKPGRFELAHQGSLFLDEIGELPAEMQPKLLRVLQEGEFERVGGTKTLKVDVRVIAATNRILEKEVEKGNFRADLFFRLNVFPIYIPPLRERKEDIPLLVTYFTQKYATKMGKSIPIISQKVIDKLQTYHWPGNVRELENIIERAIIISTHKLEIGDWLDNQSISKTPNKILSLEELEKQHILKVLKLTKGKINGRDGAAEILQIHPSTLRSRMEKLGINSSEKNFDIS